MSSPKHSQKYYNLNVKLNVPNKKEKVEVLFKEIEFGWSGVDNDGIGAYEYWGAKGNDRGNDYLADFEIVGALWPNGRSVLPKVIEMIDIDPLETMVNEDELGEDPDDPGYYCDDSFYDDWGDRAADWGGCDYP